MITNKNVEKLQIVLFNKIIRDVSHNFQKGRSLNKNVSYALITMSKGLKFIQSTQRTLHDYIQIAFI